MYVATALAVGVLQTSAVLEDLLHFVSDTVSVGSATSHPDTYPRFSHAKKIDPDISFTLVPCIIGLPNPGHESFHSAPFDIEHRLCDERLPARSPPSHA